MKILVTISALSLLFIFSNCKKEKEEEDLTKNFPGTYMGVAVYSPFPDTAKVTYPTTKIVITRIDKTSIRFTVTLDPAEPSKILTYEAGVGINKTSFYGTIPGPRGVQMPLQQGSLINNHLIFQAIGPLMHKDLDFAGERI